MIDRISFLMLARLHAARTDSERGDVPGWVMITLMTVAVATAIWALVDGSIMSVLESALESVTGDGSSAK